MEVVADLDVRGRARKVGNPDVHVAIGIRKTARHDADHPIIIPIHAERLSNRAAQTAELALPQAIADHHEPGRFEPVLIRKKCAAGNRRYAKRRKKISGTVAFVHSLGIDAEAPAGERYGAGPDSGDLLEACGQLLPVEKSSWSDAH